MARSCGVLPLAHVKTTLFGHTLVSTPFCVYGGPLPPTAETCAPRSRRTPMRLRERARRLGTSRCAIAPTDGAATGSCARDLYVTFRKPIAGRRTRRNMKAIPRKQRAMVRKGIQNGPRIGIDRDVDASARVYAESVRNLGTPVFSRRYFAILQRGLRRDCAMS